MRATLAIPFLLLLAAAQLIASERLRFFGAAPDLLLAATLAIAVRAHATTALASAWAIGLLKALASAGPPGLEPALFVLAAALVLCSRRAVYADSPITQFILAIPLVFVIHLAYGGSLVAGGAALPWERLVRHAAAVAVYTAVTVPAVFGLWSGLLGTPRLRTAARLEGADG